MPLDEPPHLAQVTAITRKEELTVVLSFLDDARRIIEGGKGRRWAVFNRAIALNLIIASTAALPADRLPVCPSLLTVAAFLSSALAAGLIIHYGDRMFNSRQRANNLYAWLAEHVLDVHKIMGERTIRARDKDRFENFIFLSGITLSLVAVAIAIPL